MLAPAHDAVPHIRNTSYAGSKVQLPNKSTLGTLSLCLFLPPGLVSNRDDVKKPYDALLISKRGDGHDIKRATWQDRTQL